MTLYYSDNSTYCPGNPILLFHASYVRFRQLPEESNPHSTFSLLFSVSHAPKDLHCLNLTSKLSFCISRTNAQQRHSPRSTSIPRSSCPGSSEVLYSTNHLHLSSCSTLCFGEAVSSRQFHIWGYSFASFVMPCFPR